MKQKILCLFLGLSSYGFLWAQQSEPDDTKQGFAVVELFTSQGCSSCPPADAYLTALTDQAQEKELPIYTLSFHVDYWDYLGWKDPFGDSAYTRRQRDYASHMRSTRVYTPQMIVNGTAVFVGSDRQEGAELIQKALKQTASFKGKIVLDLQREADRVAVTFAVGSDYKGDVLQLAIVESNLKRHVRRGENRNRKLQHDHVVRVFHTSKLNAMGSGTVELTIPKDIVPEQAKVIAYVQKRGPGRVLAAAMKAL